MAELLTAETAGRRQREFSNFPLKEAEVKLLRAFDVFFEMYNNLLHGVPTGLSFYWRTESSAHACDALWAQVVQE